MKRKIAKTIILVVVITSLFYSTATFHDTAYAADPVACNGAWVNAGFACGLSYNTCILDNPNGPPGEQACQNQYNACLDDADAQWVLCILN